MLGGIKYCGGCNPRFERRKTLESIKEHFQGRVIFENVQEDKEYDFVIVISGCTNCCASYSQYYTKNEFILLWDENHIDRTINKIEEILGGN